MMEIVSEFRIHRLQVCLCVIFVAACGGSGHPAPEQSATETDGIVTTGLEGEGGDGIDDTAAEVPYSCIFEEPEPPSSYEGVKHQCGIEYDLSVTFTLKGPGGSSIPVPPLELEDITTLSDQSTYEHPFVAICCTDVTTHPDWEFSDSCGYLHHKACMSDFLEHICAAPGNWLEAIASDFSFQGEEVVIAAATWLKDNRTECYNHFWSGPDSLHTADYCDEQYNGRFDHTPWEPSQTFQYKAGSLVLFEVSGIVVSPRSSFDEDVPSAPPTPAESCSGPIHSNDGESPPLVQPGFTGSFYSPVAPVDIDVFGPLFGGENISGSGEFGTNSVLQSYTNTSSQLEIEYWMMTENAATTVGTSSVAADIEVFKLSTTSPHTAAVIPGGWELAAGSVMFDLSASVDGIGASVQATNSTAIEFYTIAGGVGSCPPPGTCLASGPFSIDYEDTFAQQWTVDVATATWRQ